MISAIITAVITLFAYLVGYKAGCRLTHQKWESAFKAHGHVERGKHGDVLSIGISHRGHFWRPSPQDPSRSVILPTACRYKAGGASCIHWCGNGECMK